MLEMGASSPLLTTAMLDDNTLLLYVLAPCYYRGKEPSTETLFCVY